MCGIAGELRFDARPGQADWEAISELMVRRGPDDSGAWQDERCNLVFRRLSILDLSAAGHQPMVSADGRYVLVFNGEVYNFHGLRRQLEQRGVRFRSHSDSEVVLYALAEWGRAALDRFNGMFALGFYDTRERKLLLARDHAGIKPLYYLRHQAGLMFGSQYDQLLAHPWSEGLPFSPAAATLYLHLASVPAPWAILENTGMLEPGGWLEVNADGRIRQGCYYEFPRHQAPLLRGREALDAVDAAITTAVKRQLVSDVPIGAFLSGGVDSPLVCAKMQAVCDSGMRAFTIGTGGDSTDESRDAVRYARELGIEQTLEHVAPDDAVDMLDDVVSACGEPFGDFSIFPTLLVCRLARRDFTVMLSGDGGDELFWGYAQRFGALMNGVADFRRSRRWRRALRVGRRVFRLPYTGSHLHQSVGDWQRAMHSRLPGQWLQRIFPGMPGWPAEYDLYDYRGCDPDDAAQWLRRNEFVGHLTGVLLKVDRASMYNSLEVRVPLLDREVIDVAVRVDWRDCFDPAQQVGKIPLRKSLARHLRSQTSAKRGFEPPMGKWLRTTLRPAVEETLLTRDHLAGVAVDRKALAALYREHLDGRDYGWGLWPLLSLALWEKRYGR
ncbi:MAG: asparagine synthase (glutamine-hydrolyzing) [Thiogranum sp.]